MLIKNPRIFASSACCLQAVCLLSEPLGRTQVIVLTQPLGLGTSLLNANRNSHLTACSLEPEALTCPSPSRVPIPWALQELAVRTDAGSCSQTPVVLPTGLCRKPPQSSALGTQGNVPSSGHLPRCKPPEPALYFQLIRDTACQQGWDLTPALFRRINYTVFR